MSKATKRKHVTKEVTEEFVLPDEQLQIVKIVSSRGNNLHEVLSSDSTTFLVSMPTKFRKNVWIKRGDYVMVKPIEEGDRVRAEIAHILYKPQMSYIQQENKWPAAFNTDATCSAETCPSQMIPDDMLPPCIDSEGSETDSENEGGREPDCSNPNRVWQQRVKFSASDDDDSNDNGNDNEDSNADDDDDCINSTIDSLKKSSIGSSK